MTRTGAPVSVTGKISLATTLVAVTNKAEFTLERSKIYKPVFGYKSKIATSLPVAPGTEYLKRRGIVHLFLLLSGKILKNVPAWITNARTFDIGTTVTKVSGA